MKRKCTCAALIALLILAYVDWRTPVIQMFFQPPPMHAVMAMILAPPE
jgi:hypothetical protein